MLFSYSLLAQAYLTISVFYPVVGQHQSSPVAYMPPETALIEDNELGATGLATPNGTFGQLALQLAGHESSQNVSNQTFCQYPVVIFMPGTDTTRFFYSQITSDIASNGYTVVTIDAPYDVDIVQYTDGSFANINLTLRKTPDNTSLAQTAYLAIQTRVDDVSFVLDSLSNISLAISLIPSLPPSGLNTTHTVMFGHSLGGATAFSILDMDERILGGLNMDDNLYGPDLPNGSSKPFMFMGQTITHAIMRMMIRVSHCREDDRI